MAYTPCSKVCELSVASAGVSQPSVVDEALGHGKVFSAEGRPKQQDFQFSAFIFLL